jgi:hypothetical protein
MAAAGGSAGRGDEALRVADEHLADQEGRATNASLTLALRCNHQ